MRETKPITPTDLRLAADVLRSAAEGTGSDAANTLHVTTGFARTLAGSFEEAADQIDRFKNGLRRIAYPNPHSDYGDPRIIARHELGEYEE